MVPKAVKEPIVRRRRYKKHLQEKPDQATLNFVNSVLEGIQMEH